MLNKTKIKAMAQIAIFEEGSGKKNKKISTYYQWDYISMHVIISLFWHTVGYAMVAGLWFAYNFVEITNEWDSIDAMVSFGIQMIVVWLILLLITGTLSGVYFYYRYELTQQDHYEYQRQVKRLNKVYKRRKKNG